MPVAFLRVANGGAAECRAAAAEVGEVPRGDNAANNETRTPGNAPANGRKRTHAKTCTNSKKGRPCRKVKQFTASRA